MNNRLNLILPIEKIEARYSAQWWTWTLDSLARHPEWHARIVGDPAPQKIRTGQFLDVYGTNAYKSNQLTRTIELLEETGDQPATVLLYDAWFPGLEALAYIREATGRDIRLVGVFHAGTYDPHDFLTRRGMAHWGEPLERSWMKLLTKVLVATEFHREWLIWSRGANPMTAHVVSFPVFEDEERRIRPKRRAVVFPHRLAPEKQPEVFADVANAYREEYPDDKAEFLYTVKECRTKTEYYDLLASCKVSFSSALQETFGIAIQESINMGCVPVVPDTLAYCETVPSMFRYRRLNQALIMIRGALDGKVYPPAVCYHADMDPILKEAFE